MKNLFKRSGNVASAPTSSGQTIATALAKATSNTVQPLQQQEMLFLLGASVREPPAMAAAWLDRIISLGKQAEAVLKMLTVLHRLQARVPAPKATSTPPLHHPCTTSAPPLHHPCTTSAPPLYHLRTTPASPLHLLELRTRLVRAAALARLRFDAPLVLRARPDLPRRTARARWPLP